MEHYDRAYVETPMGTAEIVGDNFGIISISVIDDKIRASANIPESLIDCAKQLREYFEGGRTAFTLNLNPKGTDFQKKSLGSAINNSIWYYNKLFETNLGIG
jgi:methylated-DNA-[protein]-cysteine S-methyltransferase